VVTPEAIYEQLKQLRAPDLERTAEFVRHLRNSKTDERLERLRRTHGSLTTDEADEMERAIAQGCEQIDADKW